MRKVNFTTWHITNQVLWSGLGRPCTWWRLTTREHDNRISRKKIVCNCFLIYLQWALIKHKTERYQAPIGEHTLGDIRHDVLFTVWRNIFSVSSVFTSPDWGLSVLTVFVDGHAGDVFLGWDSTPPPQLEPLDVPVRWNKTTCAWSNLRSPESRGFALLGNGTRGSTCSSWAQRSQTLAAWIGLSSTSSVISAQVVRGGILAPGLFPVALRPSPWQPPNVAKHRFELWGGNINIKMEKGELGCCYWSIRCCLFFLFPMGLKF